MNTANDTQLSSPNTLAPDRPIIVVGTGRCGSTMLHRLLARHDRIGTTSTFNEVFPRQAWLSRFTNLYRIDSLPIKIRHLPFFPKPFECYKFWEHYLPGFCRRDKPQTAEDVHAPGIDPVRRATAKMILAQGKDRLLVKVTGWSRIGYFDRIFPDAQYLFLNRQPLSVVSSWVQAGWLDVTSGVDSQSWQWGPVPGDYREIWDDLGGGPLLSAAVKIQMDLDDIRSNLPLVQDRSFTMQYEDLVTKPADTLRPFLEFCDVPWTNHFQKVVDEMTFYNPANKWKKYMSEEEGSKVVEFFKRADEAKASHVSA